ncbi:DUF29 domain-containing protein [Cylindrospermum stagnale]|uniref:DUF29 domain-containing protein n=1 Tax=Cylindrospermum stagnale TaxID=142864 RepID=UPI000308FE3D
MHIPEINPKTAIPVFSLYATDFYAWTQEQVSLLRNHQWSEIDLQNLIEEIESLGKQQRQELRNRFPSFDWTFAEMGVSITTSQS